MKEIKLFVDFEFTSLSPDAQPISVGIVSEHFVRDIRDQQQLVVPSDPNKRALFTKLGIERSFYAEFSDFDINRCDDWVKENVVGKLRFSDALVKQWKINGINNGVSFAETNDSTEVAYGNSIEFWSHSARIKERLKEWLSQFSDYQITFVVDCGTWDWYHLLQLIGEWEEKEREVRDGDEIYDITSEKGILISSMGDYELIVTAKTGLPKLPSNISPVPFELNQFIAEKKGISVREAFDLDRELMGLGFHESNVEKSMKTIGSILPKISDNKHNALWDAKVMKAIYEKLSV